MVNLKWTSIATQYLKHCLEYMEKYSPKSAKELYSQVRLAEKLIIKFPKKGRIVPELNQTEIREILIRKYRLIYQILEEELIILTFLHQSQRFKL